MSSDGKRPVLDEYECARLVKPQMLHDDGTPDGAAFRLRELEEYLSVNCVDFHQGNSRQARIDDLRENLKRKMTIRTQSIAIFEVGLACKAVRDGAPDNRIISIEHLYEEDNQSHCGVFGLKQDDELVSDLLAETVVSENVVRVK